VVKIEKQEVKIVDRKIVDRKIIGRNKHKNNR